MNLTIKNIPNQITDQNTSAILNYVKNAFEYSKDKHLAFKYKIRHICDGFHFDKYFYHSGRLLNIDGSLKSIESSQLDFIPNELKSWLEIGVNINGKYFRVKKNPLFYGGSSTEIKFPELPSVHTSSSDEVSNKIYWEYRICSYNPILKNYIPTVNVTYLLFNDIDHQTEFMIDGNIKLTIRNLNFVLDYRL